MAYTAWSVVYGEQPTAAKWNQLGTNDAGFKDGTNIDAGAINNTHIASGISSSKLANPYKFHVQRTAAHNSSNSYTKIPFDTKLFDTGNNFDVTTNRRFVAPVAGFYFFEAEAGNTVAASTSMFVALYKNGTKYATGSGAGSAAAGTYCQVAALIQLAANDYVEAWFIGGGGSVMGVTADCHMSGFLVSAT